MDKERWQSIQNHFSQCIAMLESEREQWLSDLRAEDSALAAEVKSLIEHHEKSGPFLEDQPDSSIVKSISRLSRDFADEIASKSERTDQVDTFDSGGNVSTSRNESQLIQIIEEAEPDLRIESVIGYGGLGVVFQAFQISLNRQVAVKILSNLSPDIQIRRRFIHESKLAAQLNHDHIARVYSVCENAAIPFLIMELVQGISLARLIEVNHQLQPEIAATIAIQIADGLSDANRHQLVHRDIKPANILIKSKSPALDPGYWAGSAMQQPEELEAKIVDFGVAIQEIESSHDSLRNAMAGTPSYMSYEQLFDPKNVDHRSDVYGLGMTLYQMLVGTTPFRGSLLAVMNQVQTREATPVRRLDHRIPKDLESICSKAIHKDKERRYASTEKLADDLKRFLAGFPVNARPITRLEYFWSWCKRNRKTAAFAATAIFALLLTLVSALIFAIVVNNKNQQIVSEQQRTFESHIQRVIDADPGALEFAIDEIRPHQRSSAIERLSRCAGDANRSFNQRLNATIALSRFGVHESRMIVDHIDDVFASPANCKNLIMGLSDDTAGIKLLEQSLVDSTQDDAKARRIILLAHLGIAEPLIETFEATEDPSLRTEIIHMFANWHGPLDGLTQVLQEYRDKRFLWAFCQAVQQIDQRSLKEREINAVAEFCKQLAVESNHYVVHSNSLKTLQRWGLSVDYESAAKKPDWQTNSIGMRLVVVQPQTVTLGQFTKNSIFAGYQQRDVKFTKRFLVADREVSINQFKSFAESHKLELTDQTWVPAERICPTGEHPAQALSWTDAIKFCNWLSLKEGLEPAYRFVETPEEKLEAAKWKCDYNSAGYRLPTEAEWELACRVGAKTEFAFGRQADLLDYYAVNSHRKWRQANPCASLLSNSLGIYDCEGNVWEWCNDWYSEYDETAQTDPTGPAKALPNEPYKIFRGGGIGTQSGGTSADARGRAEPSVRYENLGFRVVRTAQQ